MNKTKALIIIGVLLLLEGYSCFFRGFLPVLMSAAFENEADVYMKVVNVEEGFNSDLIFYAFGIACIVLALFRAYKLKGRERDT